MKSREEIKKWLLENCVDKFGTLRLDQLDFSDFDGNIYINELVVKNNLYQNCQRVGGDLYQEGQSVGKDLCQCYQKVKGSLYQDSQEVEGSLYQDHQTVGGDFIHDNADCSSKENQELKEKLEGYETLLLHIAKELKGDKK